MSNHEDLSKYQNAEDELWQYPGISAIIFFLDTKKYADNVSLATQTLYQLKKDRPEMKLICASGSEVEKRSLDNLGITPLVDLSIARKDYEQEIQKAFEKSQKLKKTDLTIIPRILFLQAAKILDLDIFECAHIIDNSPATLISYNLGGNPILFDPSGMVDSLMAFKVVELWDQIPENLSAIEKYFQSESPDVIKKSPYGAHYVQINLRKKK